MTSELIVFEGMTSISAVLKGKKRHITEVIFDPSRERAKAKELSFLRRSSESAGFTLRPSAEGELDSLTSGSSHGGIIALCTEFTPPALTAEAVLHDGFYVMLEGVEDPYNFGYALRTLYAAGADGVILGGRSWMSAAGVVCRSSAGASELLPMFDAPAADAVVTMKSLGYKIICAGIRDSVSAFDADLKKPVFLIAGGEKRGISASVLAYADSVVRLEYGRNFRGSLSTSSAVSVLAYEILRQNRKNP